MELLDRDAEFDRLFGKTESDLLIELGEELTGDVHFGGMQMSPSDYIAFARDWLQTKKENLQELVCKSELVAKHQKASDDKNLFFAVVDVITGWATGVSPFVVSAILIQRGIGRLCEPIWNE